MTFPNINTAWGSLIIDECVRLGINYFCLAPGSRSSPLTIAVARHKKAKTMIHIDERGLAFHAVGYVTASKKPAVLIATSGTAVANFLPAIIEASKKKIPLVVMTADRPPELRQTGSVQTIDQVGIFGKYALWQCDMPCPDLAINPAMVLTTIDQAIYQAKRHQGVVHINCMFRDPLTPEDKKVKWGDYFKSIRLWEESNKPYTEYVTAFENIRIPETKRLAMRINNIKNGLIVVGKTSSEAERINVIQFARRLGWPIVADVASGLRLGDKSAEIIHYYDQILLNPKGVDNNIDGIIHLGGRMTSKRYYDFVKELKSLKEYITVLKHALRNDPLHVVTLRIESSIGNFCDSIGPLIKPRTQGVLLKRLIKLNQSIDKKIDVFFKDEEHLGEINTARLVSQLIPTGTGLFLANSMPIRDMDMYADYKGATVEVTGNRGASGIDGLIASAAGFAVGLERPVTALLGDLASLHDLNSLAMLRFVEQPLVIIVLNNGGGGIFSFLPIAQHADVFEKFFATPHGFTFANAAAMFELNYAQPQNTQQFKKAYQEALQSTTATIIEVITARESNVKMHRALQAVL